MVLRPALPLACAAAAALPAAALTLPAAASASHLSSTSTARPLTGKFLHITDFHPDPFYKTYASVSKNGACHRGHGPAGYYGAETSACDSPLTLVNATFDWIRDNVRDEIDFIVWTGDSARHDNDEHYPRNDEQVVHLNKFIVSKFREVFARSDDDDDDPTNDFIVPIVPTFGNNDILPHNIFLEGPNHWTATYLDLWRSMIPEEQRHQFQRGGWFQVEVIPNKLAVFSLNTMYFFDSNSAVDGCAIKSEPGYEHMEWLRIQLQILRERGMKAMLIGHVPPARTDNKQSWDETCWQKYALWQRQYRDVIVTSLYGHMNIDHFQLQDFNDIRPSTEKGKMKGALKQKISLDPGGDVSAVGAPDYLMDLRNEWANLPSPKKNKKNSIETAAEDRDEDESIYERIQDFVGWKKGKKRHDRYLEEIGGPWGERFSYSLVGPSIVPNYFPTLRVFDYNVTGLENHGGLEHSRHVPGERLQEIFERELEDAHQEGHDDDEDELSAAKKSKHDESSKKKKHKKKKYKFTVPKPPSKSSPPGPAYSPQTLSLLGYTQYYANLTRINNDFLKSAAYLATISSSDSGNTTVNPTSLLYADYTEGDDADFGDGFGAQRWRDGKHRGKRPKHPAPQPLPFEFEVFYQTNNQSDPFKLQDLTVRSYIGLARRIGNFNKKNDGKGGKKHKKNKKSKALGGGTEEEEDYEIVEPDDVVDGVNEVAEYQQDDDDEDYDVYETDDDDDDDDEGEESDDEERVDAEKKKKKKKKNKNKHRKKGPKHHVWYTFIERAFIGTMSRDEIDDRFGWIPEPTEAEGVDESPSPSSPFEEGLGDGEL